MYNTPFDITQNNNKESQNSLKSINVSIYQYWFEFLRQGDPNERGAQERRGKHWYHALCNLKK